ncbi:DUF2637 domain-containing protein [Streptomyces sp. NPDC090053]|uniref:DUF2637 domain-containing protein n=1 Tax=Streptomyces sp. NPDC090053 TaxID=3365932 RepID=UPI0038178D18
MTAWDGTAIILLGTAGFAFSYDALRQIAVAIHARQTLSYLFPVFIDGFIAYGVRAIVLLRNRHFGARLYAWFLFLAATGSSLGANALHAITLNHGPQAGRSALHLGDSVVGVLSTLAPLALAGSVHLYILMARTAELSVRDHVDSSPGPVRQDAPAHNGSISIAPKAGPLGSTVRAGQQGIATDPSVEDASVGAFVDLRKPGFPQASPTQPAHPQEPMANPSARTDQADGPAPAVPDHHEVSDTPTADESPNPSTVRAPADREEPSVPDGIDTPQDREADEEWLEELLPIARAASKQAGRISREAVKEAVRAHQPIGNDRLGLLLARLKEEEDAAAKTPAGSSSALW